MIRAFLYCFMLMLASLQGAQAAPATASERYRVSLLADSDAITVSEVRYLEDRDRHYTPQLFFVQLLANTVNTFTAIPFNKGQVSSRYLLGFSISNRAQQSNTLRLLTGIPASKQLRILLFDENGNRHVLLQDDRHTAYHQRNNDYRLLNSNAFTLQAGQSVFVVIDYETDGSSYLPLILGADSHITRLLETDALFSLLFYAGSSLLIGLLAWRAITQASGAYILLSILFASGLLTVSAMDGLGFHTLWPNRPAWNTNAAILMLYVTAGLGLLTAWRITPVTDNNVIARMLILLAAACSLLLAAGAGWLDRFMLLTWSYPLISLMLLALLYAMASRAGTHSQCRAVFYPAAAIAILAAVASLLYIHQNLPAGFVLMLAARIVYLAAMLAIALPAVICLRRE